MTAPSTGPTTLASSSARARSTPRWSTRRSPGWSSVNPARRRSSTSAAAQVSPPAASPSCSRKPRSSQSTAPHRCSPLPANEPTASASAIGCRPARLSYSRPDSPACQGRSGPRSPACWSTTCPIPWTRCARSANCSAPAACSPSVRAGLPTRFLPDSVAPGLLGRLDAIAEELTAAGEHPAGVVPHHGGWPDLMRAAGLEATGSRSFLLDLTAPVSTTVRERLQRRLVMLQEFVGDRATDADALALANLVDPEAPEGVLARADVFLLTASTVHTARREPSTRLPPARLHARLAIEPAHG